MINNPSDDVTYENTQISRAIWTALQTQTSNSAKNFITKMAKEETAEALAAGADIGEFSVGVSLCALRDAASFCYLQQKFAPRACRVLSLIRICDSSSESQNLFLSWKNLSKKK